MPRFKQMPMEPKQLMLFGQSVEDAVPCDSDVRGFNDVMECLDYSRIESRCSERGCPPYPPKVMIKILVYAYSKGVRSSRRIEELTNVDVRLIWLAGGLKPDHNTIARFRKENWKDLTDLFKGSVRVCAEAGLVLLNAVAVDGTKIRSAASKKRVYSQSRVDREMEAVEKILREADEVDRAEDDLYGSGTANTLPEHLRDAKARKAKLEEIAKRLNDSEKSTVVETDPESRVMMSGDGKKPCYNLQASVDATNQVIVGMDLTQNEKDSGELPKMVEQTESNIGLSPDVSLVDCGYSSEKSIKWIDESGHDVLMPLQEHPKDNDRNDLFASRCFMADEERDVLICPAGRELTFRGEHRTGSGTYRRYCANGCQNCSFYGQCVSNGRGSRRVDVSVVAAQRRRLRERLHSPDGRKLYALRQRTVEPVFGQMKSNLGFTRFLVWGVKAAGAEAALICLAHNVMKCISKAVSAGLTQTRFFVSLPRYVLSSWQTPWPTTDSISVLVNAPRF